MKAEYSHEGKNFDYINSTDETITAGTVIVFNGICAVAATTIPPGKLGAVTTVGVWTMPKDTSEISIGDKVYYDEANDKVTVTAPTGEAADNTFIGIATIDAAADAPEVNVRLNG